MSTSHKTFFLKIRTELEPCIFDPHQTRTAPNPEKRFEPGFWLATCLYKRLGDAIWKIDKSPFGVLKLILWEY